MYGFHILFGKRRAIWIGFWWLYFTKMIFVMCSLYFFLTTIIWASHFFAIICIINFIAAGISEGRIWWCKSLTRQICFSWNLYLRCLKITRSRCHFYVWNFHQVSCFIFQEWYLLFALFKPDFEELILTSKVSGWVFRVTGFPGIQCFDNKILLIATNLF